MSFNLSNLSTTVDDWYSPEAVVECSKLKFIGVYCIILFLTCMAVNPLLIWMFIKNKELLNPINILILALTVLNTMGTLMELPLTTTTAFKCKFIFKKAGCYFEAFIMYFIGCTSVYLLTFISWIRYSAIDKPLGSKSINKCLAIKAIIIASFGGLFWSIMPFFGWSEYTLEGAKISCSIEWQKRTLNVISYNIMIFIFVYLLPLALLVYTNTKTLLIMRSSRARFSHIHSEYQKQNRIKAELKLTIRTAILVAGFFVSWTPYAIVCLYAAVVDENGISPIGATLPAYFAKSSLAWPALLSIFGNKDLRKKFTSNREPSGKSDNSSALRNSNSFQLNMMPAKTATRTSTTLATFAAENKSASVEGLALINSDDPLANQDNLIVSKITNS